MRTIVPATVQAAGEVPGGRLDDQGRNERREAEHQPDVLRPCPAAGRRHRNSLPHRGAPV